MKSESKVIEICQYISLAIMWILMVWNILDISRLQERVSVLEYRLSSGDNHVRL